VKNRTVFLGNAALQATFTAIILPRVKTHARIYFRHVRCSCKRADLVAETVALAWKSFIRLADRGKDATRWPCAFAAYCTLAVKNGRRVAGQNKAKDALNERTQARKGFAVESLPLSPRTTHEDLYSAPTGQRRRDAWEERLQDNTVTPPPDQAAFRIDFPRWLRQHSARDRRILRDMARGETTSELAARYGLSQPRISQMRREAHDSWEVFTA
jgi:hypothetical protein